MKRIIVIVGAVLVLLCSCSGTPKVGIVYDESVPAEKSALLLTSQDIIAYNGIPVNWKMTFKGGILIPAGDTLLEWNINATVGNTIVKGNNMLFRYTF